MNMQPNPLSEAEQDDISSRVLTKADMGRMTRKPQVFVIRRAYDLTPEEFAARFAIPIGTLRDWEQGRTEPDATAKAYLKVIAAYPDVVEKAVGKQAA